MTFAQDCFCPRKFVQASAEPNVCARREQKPSLLGLCRAAANFRASERRAELVRAMPSAAENVKKRCIYMNVCAKHLVNGWGGL